MKVPVRPIPSLRKQNHYIATGLVQTNCSAKEASLADDSDGFIPSGHLYPSHQLTDLQEWMAVLKRL